MSNALQDALTAKAKGTTTTESPPDSAHLGPVETAQILNAMTPEEAAEVLTGQIRGVTLEAVIGETLMRLEFGERTNPVTLGGLVKAADPNAKVRSDFPSKSYGKRDTELARALVINVEVRESGRFIDLVCQNGDDLKVSVSKRQAAEWPAPLLALGKLSEKNAAKINEAFDGKKSATVILGEAEQFGVRYWKTDDGKAFVDELVAEPPVPKSDDSSDKEDKADGGQ